MKLIDKSALVAEIERRMADILDECSKSKRFQFTLYGKISALENLLYFIDTLEVKEVDFEKEFEDFVVDHPVIGDLVNFNAAEIIARHFFELGLKAKDR